MARLLPASKDFCQVSLASCSRSARLQLVALGLFKAEVLGVGGVERNPQEDETGIQVVGFLLSPGQPTDGAVQPDPGGFFVPVVGGFELEFQIGSGHFPRLPSFRLDTGLGIA